MVVLLFGAQPFVSACQAAPPEQPAAAAPEKSERGAPATTARPTNPTAPPAKSSSTAPPATPAIVPPGPTLDLSFGSARLSAHVADSPSERETGLMHVNTMSPDEGMVFAYPAPAPRFYWMKDTVLPLDIAFVGDNGRIVKLAQMAPGDTTLTPSGAPATWAVEANLGWFEAHSVNVGDEVAGLPGRAKE